MGYWTEVKDVVLKGMDLAAANIKEGAGVAIENIKQGAGTAVEKGKEGVAYAQLKKNLFLQHRKLHTLLADLGDLTRDLYKDGKDIYKDDKLQKIMEQVVQMETECKRMEQEIDGLGKKV
ncbi:MAG: hypothetical protein V1913_01290 [Fibrobacterota bacterium]